MKNIYSIILKRELTENKWMFIRQILYLIPVIALVLMFSSSQNAAYINQRVFLEHSEYEAISFNDSEIKGENVFEYYDAYIGCIEDVRGVAYHKDDYSCEIYNAAQDSYCFDRTYFAAGNVKSEMIDNLKAGEIIISYDVAKRLKVSEGDTVSIFSADSDEYCSFVVKGVMKTKYGHGNIGYKGTVLIKESNCKALHKIMDVSYCQFLQSKNGDLLKNEEITECNFLLLPAMNVVMVNIVFPLMGILLIFLLISIEIKRMIIKEKYMLAVMVTQGMNNKKVKGIIVLLEGNAVVIAIMLSLILYKYGLMQGFVGVYIPWSLLFCYLVILTLVAFILILICAKRLENAFDSSVLLREIGRKGEVDV